MRLEAKRYLYDIKQAGDLLGAFTAGKRFADHEHDAMVRAALSLSPTPSSTWGRVSARGIMWSATTDRLPG